MFRSPAASAFAWTPAGARIVPIIALMFCSGCLSLKGSDTSKEIPDDEVAVAGAGSSRGGGVAEEAPPYRPISITWPHKGPGRYAELNKELAAQLEAAGASCAKVARAMTAFTHAHKAELWDVVAAHDRWEARADPFVIEVYFDELFPFINVRIEAGARCDQDRRVRAAYKAFSETAGLNR